MQEITEIFSIFLYVLYSTLVHLPPLRSKFPFSRKSEASIFAVRRGSHSSASAYCKSGPSSNLGSALQNSSSSIQYINIVCLPVLDVKINNNKRVAACHQTFRVFLRKRKFSNNVAKLKFLI